MPLKSRIFLLALVMLPALRLVIGHYGQGFSQPSNGVSGVPRVTGTQSQKGSKGVSPSTRILTAEALFQYTQHTYQEKNASIEGPLWGLSANLMVPVDKGILLGGRGEFMSGETTYSGRYVDVDHTGVSQKVSGAAKDEFYDVGGLGTFEILEDRSNKAFLFGGMAYRSHTNRAQIDGGYTRDISAFYLPMGLNGQMDIGGSWKLRAEGEFDLLISGKTTSRLREVGPAYSDVTHEQDKGIGFRAYLRAVYQLPGVSIMVGPYYSYWKVEDSNSVRTTYNGNDTYMIEPQNTTTRFGFSLGVLY